MAGLQLPSIRHLTGYCKSHLRIAQRRWARVHDVRFVATHQTQSRVIDRYRQKLDQKVKEEGLGDINELKAAYKDKITQQQQQATLTGASSKTPPTPSSSTTSTADSPSSFRQPPPPPQPLDQLSPSSPNYKPPGLKTLSSFLDVEKTLTLPSREIESIWRLRHAAHKNSLCASIPLDTYNAIIATAKQHPQFVLPLPREGAGAEIHFMQWTFPAPNTVTVLFTHLAEYKLRGEFSQPHTTITHHLELAEPKGLVLLQGTVVEGRGVTAEEAKWLLMCMQKFYGQDAERGPAEKRRRLIEQFSQGDGDFKVEELLEEAERLP